jgi:catechol 2,3-dioxygenase
MTPNTYAAQINVVTPSVETYNSGSPESSMRTPDPYGIAPSGYRLPAETRLGHVSLQISDLGRSLDYYEQVIGLRTRERNATSAILSAHDDETPLVRLTERRGATPVPRRGVLGLYHFAILVPNRAALGRFVAHLGSVNAAVGTADHAVSEALYLTDPDGLGIEVYSDRPRPTWRADQHRQLFMTTAPLDVRSLVEAASGAPWTGLPATTRIGHVHLHVGDLARAEAFYHAALGLDKTVWEYPGALFFSAGGYHHHLGTNTWAAGPLASPDQARLLSWDLTVPAAADVSAASNSLRSAGYEVRMEDAAAIAIDPWGTTLRVVPSH